MTADGRREPRYVIVSPVRDEEQNIDATIDSVARQSVLPQQWVLVNDGSTDRTGEILDRAAVAHRWLSVIHRNDRGFRAPGTGVIDAFYEGYHSLRAVDWEFVVKLDGDLVLPTDYFEKCFAEFAREPRLGISGGIVYHLANGKEVIEPNPRFHVRGATKIYRRECWEAIGGLLKAPGWDTLDEVKAQMLGWSTRSLPELRLLHLRPTGLADGSWRNAVKNGRANYFSGYHPLFMLLKCVKRLFEPPYGTASAGLLVGFISGYLYRLPQVDSPALIGYLRRQQVRRLLMRDSIWR